MLQKSLKLQGESLQGDDGGEQRVRFRRDDGVGDQGTEVPEGKEGPQAAPRRAGLRGAPVGGPPVQDWERGGPPAAWGEWLVACRVASCDCQEFPFYSIQLTR